jgi:hypothetical protein
MLRFLIRYDARLQASRSRHEQEGSGVLEGLQGDDIGHAT